ncbi:MAG TPA: GDP-mannose 4,6-dehydratase [Abditibacterium sp.]
MKKAFITGVGGQDGAYLARALLLRGYEVWGTTRYPVRQPSEPLVRLGIANQVKLLPVDFTSIPSLACAVGAAHPDEVYNLAAQSSVAASFVEPTDTGEVTALGVARLLQALREVNPQARFYQASSSEMFGMVRETPQVETTAFYPRSPYGAAKVYAHWMTVNYRESYDMFACSGILFNHESPLRPERFVTRKICQAVARIKLGQQSELTLGNLDVVRDWGFAGDYVEAMIAMLQQDTPEDYIIATGETHSLREFVAGAFECQGLNYEDYVHIDPAFFRPAEVNLVVGDSTKARTQLKWKPRIDFPQLIAFLMDAEMRRARDEEHLVEYFPAGFLESIAPQTI